MGRTNSTHDRWRSRPVAATALRVLLFLAPIAVSLAVTLGVRSVLPMPATLGGKISAALDGQASHQPVASEAPVEAGSGS